MNRKKTEAQTENFRQYISPVLQDFPVLATLSSLTGVHAIIHDRIWDFVLNGDLEPGAKVPELQIGEAFNVSRTIVRNVLIVMEQADIITLPANRGAYIAIHSPEKIQHAFEVAKLTTTHVARTLAANAKAIPAENIAQLKRHIAYELPQEIARSNRTQMRFGMELPILLSAIHGNSLLTALLDRVASIILISSSQFQYRQAAWPVDEAQKEIVSQILAGKPDAAEKAVENYIDTLQQTFDYQPQERNRDVYSIISSLSDGVSLPSHARRRSMPRRKERR